MFGKVIQKKVINQENEFNVISSQSINIWDSKSSPNKLDLNKKQKNFWNFSYIPLGVIFVLLFLVVLLPLLDQIDIRIQYSLNKQLSVAQDRCIFELVESIPEGLVYPNASDKYSSTFETWKKLIKIAESSIEIGSFYWSLRQSEEFPVESQQGDEIFNDLLNAGLNRNIVIRIAQSSPTKSFPSNDTEFLLQKKAAQVKFVNFDELIGNGVLHTKFWLVDRKHFYLGSANLDWRSLTEVKELGIAMYNCSSVTQDLAKIFDVYWTVGNQTSLPNKWPDSLSTRYNSNNPFVIYLNGHKSSLYITSSPPQLSTKGRNDDLDALLKVINNAEKFVYISVMDYMPLILFSRDLKYWPIIDEQLRKAVVDRHVKVKLLISLWRSTRPMELHFLKSLQALDKFSKTASLEVKLFIVPSNSQQNKIPFARVNHNKYMVTDNAAFIGTSNWSGDYFLYTAGVSLVSPSVNGSSIQEELKNIFDRDWNSPFAHSLNKSIIA